MSDQTQFRTYNSPGGGMVFGTQYVLDTTSGVFRPLYTSDLGGGAGSNVTIVGPLPLPVNANVTGGNITAVVTGNVSIDDQIGITGTVNVTGTLVGTSGLFTSFVTGITGSQLSIPVGVKNYGIYIESGFGFMNGALLNQGVAVNGGVGAAWTLGTAITIGTTGSAASPARIVISWDS